MAAPRPSEPLDGGGLLAGEPPAGQPGPGEGEMERRWREVQADIRARRRRREKALKTLGLSVDAFERRKALEVLGLREEDLEAGRRYFVYPGRRAVSLPSLEDARGEPEEEREEPEEPPPALAASASAAAAAAHARPSSAGWGEEPLTPQGVLFDGLPAYAARHMRRRSSLPGARVVRPKAVRVLGMDDHQVRRVKALTLLGVSDYEVEEDTSRALSQLGIQSPRDRMRSPPPA